MSINIFNVRGIKTVLMFLCLSFVVSACSEEESQEDIEQRKEIAGKIHDYLILENPAYEFALNSFDKDTCGGSSKFDKFISLKAELRNEAIKNISQLPLNKLKASLEFISQNFHNSVGTILSDKFFYSGEEGFELLEVYAKMMKSGSKYDGIFDNLTKALLSRANKASNSNCF